MTHPTSWPCMCITLLQLTTPLKRDTWLFMNALFTKSFFLVHLWKLLSTKVFSYTVSPFRPHLHISILIGRDRKRANNSTDWYTVTYHYYQEYIITVMWSTQPHPYTCMYSFLCFASLFMSKGLHFWRSLFWWAFSVLC